MAISSRHANVLGVCRVCVDVVRVDAIAVKGPDDQVR